MSIISDICKIFKRIQISSLLNQSVRANIFCNRVAFSLNQSKTISISTIISREIILYVIPMLICAYTYTYSSLLLSSPISSNRRCIAMVRKRNPAAFSAREVEFARSMVIVFVAVVVVVVESLIASGSKEWRGSMEKKGMRRKGEEV